MNNTIWAKGKSNEKNCTLAFALNLSCNRGDKISLSVAASNIYKLYMDGVLIGYGPARAAHGFARIDDYEFLAQKNNFNITVEIVSYQVNSYYLILEEPFFDCDVKINGQIVRNSHDFICYHLNDRVQKVQRYSFQRPFIEYYKGYEREKLYMGESVSYPIMETENVEKRIYIPRGVAYPKFEKIEPCTILERGSVQINPNNECWRDRSHDSIGETLLGFSNDEIEEMISDRVCSFDYIKNDKSNNTYTLYEFPILQTGLINLEIEVLEDCEIYITFEEILWQEKQIEDSNAPLNLCFWRGECANIIKYSLKKGRYALQSFEIYTLKYLKVISIGGAVNIKSVSITEIETPSARQFTAKISDNKLQAIVDAAINTFSQNSLDLFMDCPSRERAGWTNDSFFTAYSSHLFTGEYQIEKNFIENVIASPDLKHIPKGVLPMCYPCDHYDGVYSPTCSMWFVLQCCRYCRDSLNGIMPNDMKNKILGLIDFVDKYINDDGLIEDMDGWVFIEWSAANDPEYVSGVNYPTNMLYCKLLKDFGTLISDDALVIRAAKMKQKILEQSYNGERFEDNRIRENGELILCGHSSETCQYFAFFLEIADKKEYSILYKDLVDNYIHDPENKDRNRSNIIIGLILRMTLLLQDNRIEQLVNECRELLYKMALRTGTLWEMVDIRASCNHNIASYFAVLLICALTGFRGIKNEQLLIHKKNVGIDCEFSFKQNGKNIKISLNNKGVYIDSELPVQYIDNNFGKE